MGPIFGVPAEVIGSTSLLRILLVQGLGEDRVKYGMGGVLSPSFCSGCQILHTRPGGIKLDPCCFLPFTVFRSHHCSRTGKIKQSLELDSGPAGGKCRMMKASPRIIVLWL